MLNSIKVALACAAWWVLTGGIAMAATPGGPASPTAAPGEAAAAMRLCEMAREALQAPQIVPGHWQQSAALLEAATRLDPSEPRYWRLLVEARLQSGDGEGAIEALKNYTRLQPSDRAAQIDRIGLYVDRMQSADQRLSYLKAVVAQPGSSVADEVRSAAATRAARLLLDRSVPEARGMLQEALRLNPLNTDALSLKYELVAREGSAQERAATLLAMLKANPARIDRISALAAELADAGMVEESLKWYAVGMNAATRSQMSVPPDYAMNYAVELLLANNTQAAQALADELLNSNPNDYGFLMLRLLVERSGGKKDAADVLARKARNALTNRLAQIRAGLGVSGATTRPVDSERVDVPELSDDVVKLAAVEDPNVKNAYLWCLAELAWFDVYLEGQSAEAARLNKMLAGLLPEGSPVVARVAGWCYLLDGKNDEAKVKLSAVADKDPLAGLGLVQLARKVSGAEAARESAQKLLDSAPSGVMGAIVRDAVRDLGVAIHPKPYAAAIKQELEKFPSDWLRVLDSPQMFYTLRAEPLKTAHAYGEPMLAKVTIQNISDYDLSVGPDGLIRADLWFDAQLMGLSRQQFAGVCYERLNQGVVLRARQSMSQVVRVDQGELGRLFATNPTPTIQVMFTVRTNPSTSAGGLGFGPGGYSAAFGKLMQRSGFAVTDASIKKLEEAATGGSPQERLRSLELLSVFSQGLRRQEDPAAKATATAILQALRNAGGDADPGVRMWAKYLFTLSCPDDTRTDAIQQMLKDGLWSGRLAGLLGMQGLAAEYQKALALPLGQSDADPVVKRYAAATVNVMDMAPPATQPSNGAAGPATRPATAPVAR